MCSCIPAYVDIGKAARDLFCKGYNYGSYKMDIKTKISSDMELIASGAYHHDPGNVAGSMQFKNKALRDWGLSWSTKWTLENMISAEASIEDKPLKGLKLSFDGQFVPLTGKKNATLRTAFKNSSVHGSLSADLGGACLSGSAVVGHNGFLGGAQLTYDFFKSAVSQFNVAFARSHAEYTINLSVNNWSNFQSAVYHKVNDKLDLGYKIEYSTDRTDTKFSMAAKYSVDKDLVLRAKLNNRCEIGFGYQHQIHNAVTLTLSALIEGKRLNQPCHKFGVGLEFEF